MCDAPGSCCAGLRLALSTYLGHASIRHTYWYLEATPDLMGDIAAAAEALIEGEVA